MHYVQNRPQRPAINLRAADVLHIEILQRHNRGLLGEAVSCDAGEEVFGDLRIARGIAA